MLLISSINFCIYYLFVPGPLTKDTTIIIKPKISITQIATILNENNIVKYPTLFALLTKGYSLKYKIKSGEYTFTQNISPIQTIRILASGKSIIHKVVVSEGTIVSEVINKINTEERLTGEIIGTIPEGFLMPSTYFYSYGDQKEQIISKMRKLMSAELDKVMVKLSPTSLLKTRLDVLTLASIVEKEATLDEEKPIIAAVFLNRMKRGMRLQSCATAIYAITLGQHKLGRNLTRKDLAIESPYNTYRRPHLPPGPICCPGTKSLEAVVNPANVNFLYFVSNGQWGHYFATNYAEHLRHVNIYRKGLKE